MGIENRYEVPTQQTAYHVEVEQLTHQPFVVAVDVSGSMNHVEDGQTKSNLQLAEELVNRIGHDSRITDLQKRAVDLCIMTFEQTVVTELDWTPLSEYSGGITLKSGNTTAFHDAVKQAMNAVRSMKANYQRNGIQCKRPQIYVITDGYSTDPRDNPAVVEEAKKLCRYYLEGESPKVTLNVIYLPGGSTTDARALSQKVNLYKVDDCKEGLPAIEKFINASIVAFSSSSPGETARIELPAEIKTTTPTKRGPDGKGVVEHPVENSETWY